MMTPGASNLRSRFEFAAAIITGAGHVAIELTMRDRVFASISAQYIFNIVAAALWSVYILWRAAKTPSFLMEAGFRREGFLDTFRVGTPVAASLLLLPAGYAFIMGRLALPPAFWITIGLYPLWGIAQQFALQVLVTTPLKGIVPDIRWRVAASAALFSASHYPNTELVGLTLVAGVLFTALYENYRNLWAVGILHGIMGSAAYYWVLGDDPGMAVLKVVGMAS